MGRPRKGQQAAQQPTPAPAHAPIPAAETSGASPGARGPQKGSQKAPRKPRQRKPKPPAPSVVAAAAAGVLPPMVPQPHGGMLLRGGIPGNASNSIPKAVSSGRINARLREALEEVGVARMVTIMATGEDSDAVAAFKAALHAVRKAPTTKTVNNKVTALIVELRDESGPRWRSDASVAVVGHPLLPTPPAPHPQSPQP